MKKQRIQVLLIVMILLGCFESVLGASFFCDRVYLENYLNLEDRSHLQRVYYSWGSGWSDIFISHISENRLFIKVINPQTRDSEQYINEAKILRSLNGFDFIPKLESLEILSDGRLALVTQHFDFVLQIHGQPLSLDQRNFLIQHSDSIEGQVDYILQTLRRQRVIPNDFQFGVTASGKVILFDLEYYQIQNSPEVIWYTFARDRFRKVLYPLTGRLFDSSSFHLNASHFDMEPNPIKR